MTDLTFEHLRTVNLSRSAHWRLGGDPWAVSDWAVAMAGEAGEVCNAVKKLRRIEDGLPNLNDGNRQLSTRAEAIAAISAEIADTLICLDLLAAHLNIDLSRAVTAKFNATSIRYGFDERLGDGH
jgi:NTP pyrophosphatase (non-canonical NTP hydrolase)